MIEALLQQDVDLGLTRHDFDPVRSPLEEVEPVPEKSARLDDEVRLTDVGCWMIVVGNVCGPIYRLYEMITMLLIRLVPEK